MLRQRMLSRPTDSTPWLGDYVNRRQEPMVGATRLKWSARSSFVLYKLRRRCIFTQRRLFVAAVGLWSLLRPGAASTAIAAEIEPPPVEKCRANALPEHLPIIVTAVTRKGHQCAVWHVHQEETVESVTMRVANWTCLDPADLLLCESHYHH